MQPFIANHSEWSIAHSAASFGDEDETHVYCRSMWRVSLSPGGRILNYVANVLAIFSASSIAYGQGEATWNSLSHEGHERNYHLYVPESYSGEHPAPVVISLHGRNSSSQRQMDFSGMNEVADREGFLVAYPNAIDGSWSNGSELTVGFIDELLDEIRSTHSVDSSRIYATGASQGAVTTYLLAVERPNLFAAIAPNAGLRPLLSEGGLYPAPLPNVPNRPFPIIHVHGTADDVIPFHGGAGFPSVNDVLDEWLDNNHCERAPDISEPDGAESVTIFTYGNCGNYIGVSNTERSAEVALYQVNGGTHTWPEDASTAVWDFFSRHELPASSVNALAPGEEYSQSFDVIPNTQAGNTLPVGWSATGRGVVTTATFPPENRTWNWSLFTAAANDSDDQALAVGVTPRGRAHTPELQFLAQVANADAMAFQLEFDLEGWYADAAAARESNQAAFDVSIEVDSGDGFFLVRPFENVGTETLSLPKGGGVLSGDSPENRLQFDSGSQFAPLSEGSIVRIRWKVPESEETKGLVFGVDNVQLRFFESALDAFDCNSDGVLDVADANCATVYSLDATLDAASLIKGDLDGNGVVDLADFATLSNLFGEDGKYTDGDLDLDGEVTISDFRILAENFGNTPSANAAAVPEPAAFSLLLCALLSIRMPCKQRVRQVESLND